MIDDLVERLRNVGYDMQIGIVGIANEAADEIERLQKLYTVRKCTACGDMKLDAIPEKE